jgi:hypothetical protein
MRIMDNVAAFAASRFATRQRRTPVTFAASPQRSLARAR